MTGSRVAVGVVVLVGVAVGVSVGIKVAVGASVAVAVGVQVGITVGVSVAVGVTVGVAVGVGVGVSVGMDVLVGVCVAVGVGVQVGVAVGVQVGITVGVADGLGSQDDNDSLANTPTFLPPAVTCHQTSRPLGTVTVKVDTPQGRVSVGWFVTVIGVIWIGLAHLTNHKFWTSIVTGRMQSRTSDSNLTVKYPGGWLGINH